MEMDQGYSRYFSYMNLFVASMLILVLANNLLLLLLGWEGVGLCSYLLIGFWYSDPMNGRAARKAFFVTRLGDTAMVIGLFVIFFNLRTLEIQTLLQTVSTQWQVGSPIATLTAALLLCGALGKSAQFPLHVWLPDAMAGPTPVSALIHAATMVTAGVYLIARTHILFLLAPPIQFAVAIIGALTLLMAACCALTQSDIKRILAYSTISQVGYMFLALGVGAWSAALFHFMTHAFFKALLFLGAGAIIHSLHEQHNIFRMGGLRRQMPGVFWTFFIGAASLSALPWVTAGFYSKDLIINAAYSSPYGNVWLWIASLVGAFLTSVYSFRLIFVVFFGPAHAQSSKKSGPLMMIPLIVLAVFSLMGGWIDVPTFLHSTFTVVEGPEHALAWAAPLVSLTGIFVAYLLYYLYPRAIEKLLSNAVGRKLHQFWYSGWGFDWLYDHVLVQPFYFFAYCARKDALDLLPRSIAWALLRVNHSLSRLQNGKMRWYAAGIAWGAALILLLTEVL
jgi:NADH-quinone oxidoreductase subunit L